MRISPFLFYRSAVGVRGIYLLPKSTLRKMNIAQVFDDSLRSF